MKEEMCDYCGENKRQITIPNPNGMIIPGDEEEWQVCIPCSKIIPLQKEQSMLHYLNSIHSSPELDKRLKQVEKQIKEVAHEDGQKVFGAEIRLTKDGKLSSKRMY